MGLANEHQIREAQEDRKFSFGREYLLRYPGLCTQCGARVCICPAIPPATIGRMAKELSIQPNERIFIEDGRDFASAGEVAAQRALEEMGGYQGLISKLPFDRGDTNEALVTICMKMAVAVESAKPELASSLRAEALKLRDAEQPPGVRSDPLEVGELLQKVQSIWADLDEEHRQTIKSSPGIAGDLGGILDAPNNLNVLFVSCDPDGELGLEAEKRAVHEALARAPHGKKVKIDHIFAATTDDLRRQLLVKDYQIVHFSGHANSEILLFANSEHEPTPIPISAVAELIARYPTVQCVVLNACEALRALEQSIAAYTIGMDEAIPDKAAIEFSKGFYDALGAGKTIKLAFDEGVTAIKLASFAANYVKLLELK